MAEAAEFLRISNLHAWYGESHILHGVDLTVHKGEVVTLLGRNGAGRTTTIKSIVGLVGKRTGSITINGTESIGIRSPSWVSATAPKSAASLRPSVAKRTCCCPRSSLAVA
jgi:ABC-type branched-subunit amino acid transport system ATPase component